MRFLSSAVLLCSLAFVGCGNDTKVVQPKDTVPAPKADEITGGGTGGGAAKAPAKPAK